MSDIFPPIPEKCPAKNVRHKNQPDYYCVTVEIVVREYILGRRCCSSAPTNVAYRIALVWLFYRRPLKPFAPTPTSVGKRTGHKAHVPYIDNIRAQRGEIKPSPRCCAKVQKPSIQQSLIDRSAPIEVRSSQERTPLLRTFNHGRRVLHFVCSCFVHWGHKADRPACAPTSKWCDPMPPTTSMALALLPPSSSAKPSQHRISS